MNTWHKATDRRCYNGANCSDLQREQNSIDKLKRKAAKLGAKWTYFPMECKWTVYLNYSDPAPMHDYLGDALVEFLDKNDNGKGV